jgi:hypothetical protein
MLMLSANNQYWRPSSWHVQRLPMSLRPDLKVPRFTTARRTFRSILLEFLASSCKSMTAYKRPFP